MRPFADHPLRRYDYAWRQLANRFGRHLDFGCGHAEFLDALARHSRLECYGVDRHSGYLAEVRQQLPWLRVSAVSDSGTTDFADGFFHSASLLDVLEHVQDETRTLTELHRVLSPGGILVVTVPARHVFSCLDPDNFKFRFPRLHRWVYIRKFGRERYRTRFEDLSDGLRGDMAVNRTRHTNYRPDVLVRRLEAAGFRCVDRDGANLFWRLLHGPSLLSGAGVKRLLDRCILMDGKYFHVANLFLTLQRP